MSARERAWVAGQRVPRRTWIDLAGREIRIPDANAAVHLQFRRFAGCPVCDLHLRSFERRQDEIASAGVREVVAFHSTAAELRRYGAEHLPFSVIADPDKRLYREFGVEAAPRSLLDPRAWPAILRAVASALWLVLRHRRRLPPIRPEGGRFGLPADFLIAQDGTVLSCHYGTHVFDQWSVDAVLLAARNATRERGQSESCPASEARRSDAKPAKWPSLAKTTPSKTAT